MQILVKGHRNRIFGFCLVDAGKRKQRVLAPIPASHFQESSIAQGINGRFKQVDGLAVSAAGQGEGVVLITSGYFTFEVAVGPSERRVTCSSSRVISDKYRIVVFLCLKQELVAQAVVDDLTVDAAPHQIVNHSVAVLICLRQQQPF